MEICRPVTPHQYTISWYRPLAVKNTNDQYLFWTGRGTRERAATNWQERLSELFHAAGFPKGHSHQFRHTFARVLLSRGVPLEEVSRLLGHTSIRVTEQYYGKWCVSRQQRVIDLMKATWAKEMAASA